MPVELHLPDRKESQLPFGLLWRTAQTRCASVPMNNAVVHVQPHAHARTSHQPTLQSGQTCIAGLCLSISRLCFFRGAIYVSSSQLRAEAEGSDPGVGGPAGDPRPRAAARSPPLHRAGHGARNHPSYCTSCRQTSGRCSSDTVARSTCCLANRGSAPSVAKLLCLGCCALMRMILRLGHCVMCLSAVELCSV